MVPWRQIPSSVHVKLLDFQSASAQCCICFIFSTVLASVEFRYQSIPTLPMRYTLQAKRHRGAPGDLPLSPSAVPVPSLFSCVSFRIRNPSVLELLLALDSTRLDCSLAHANGVGVGENVSGRYCGLGCETELPASAKAEHEKQCPFRPQEPVPCSFSPCPVTEDSLRVPLVCPVGMNVMWHQ